MKRLVALLGFALFLLLPTSVAAAECQFVLGFNTLRDIVGHDIVGECLEDEHYEVNGDSLQQTTGGLLVWRKADNWTAFTDGYRTWINGPNGLQERLNTQRFAWEGDRSPVTSIVTSAHPPASAPAPARSLLELTMASPWVRDGIDRSDKYQVEPIAIRALQLIDRNNPQLAEVMSRWAWVFDGDMNISEAYAINALSRLDGEFSSFARHLTSLPWIQDGIDNGEMSVVFNLIGVATNRDPQFAFELATAPWVVDGVTFLESFAGVSSLTAISSPPQEPRFSSGEARRVLSFVNYPPTEVDFYLVRALATFQDRSSVGLSRLYAEPWVADGLDEFERIYLIAFAGSDRELDELFEPYHIATTSITLPHSGVVNLWIVRRQPYHPGHLDLQNLAEAVRASEQFWELPFPVDHVILSLLKPDTRGGHFGRMMLLGIPDGMLTAAPYHEVAHYYFNSGPTWFTEGGANILRLFGRNSGEIPPVDFPKYCLEQGIHNIQALNDFPNRVAGSAWDRCRYTMGLHFLVALRETMGDEAWRSALRAFYLSVGYRGLYLSGWTGEPEDEEIYHVFLEHTPPHLVEAVKDVFRRLHGGPFVD